MMVRTYIPHTEECSRAKDFLDTIFGYICDGFEPELCVLILEAKSKKNGYTLKLYADGDMYCIVYVYDDAGQIARTFHWQGSHRVGNMSLDDFKTEIDDYLDSFIDIDPKKLSFLKLRDPQG